MGGIKIGTWNKNDSLKDMFVNQREDIEIQLKNLDMRIVGITETNVKKTDNAKDLEIPGYKLLCDE